MPTDRVFTTTALQAILENASDEWFETLDIPNDGTWDVAQVAVDGTVFVVHRNDTVESRRIVIIAQGHELFSPAERSMYKMIFRRIHRLSLSAEHPPIRLPPEYNEFHYGNLISFFATNRTDGNLRWVAEIGPGGSKDVCLWKLTSLDDIVFLESFSPPLERYGQIISAWQSAFSQAERGFLQLPQPAKSTSLHESVDLDVTTFGAVTKYVPFSAWNERLTDSQRDFVFRNEGHSIKVRGPAGSGKTLILELKCLHALYEARHRKQEIRILFATHSWAMALQVDDALRTMDESGDISAIDVFPLLEIARTGLPSERAGHGFKLLGEDNLSGKRLQLSRIKDLTEQFINGDWIAYRRKVSDDFRMRVESSQDSPERIGLVWDLMNEFSCVLSANGILPGVNAERQYLSIQRTPWMMSLANDAEKRFVLAVYTKYVAALKAESYLTSDQLINDYLNYLETFTWNIRREKEGYDLIFVDELHLFNEQERLVLHYLTRSPDVYPRMFMALDPRQSPLEVYAQISSTSIARAESGVADAWLGDVTSLELTTVHRFSPEILGLVQHIHNMYPALELGPDWELDVGALNSASEHGERPILFQHANGHMEIESILSRANDMLSSSSSGERIAVILLDALQISAFKEAANTSYKGQFAVIEGRSEVDSLRYSRRSIVLSAAEYVAGLQFSRVIVGAFPPPASGHANQGLTRRRLLSLLYLAISRATRYVEVHVNDAAGGIPEVLASAARSGSLAIA